MHKQVVLNIKQHCFQLSMAIAHIWRPTVLTDLIHYIWDTDNEAAYRCSGLVVEYRTRNREVAGSTHTQSTASNLEQVANLLVLRPTQPPTLSGAGNE